MFQQVEMAKLDYLLDVALESMEAPMEVAKVNVLVETMDLLLENWMQRLELEQFQEQGVNIVKLEIDVGVR